MATHTLPGPFIKITRIEDTFKNFQTTTFLPTPASTHTVLRAQCMRESTIKRS
jgi:hypothetical protein